MATIATGFIVKNWFFWLFCLSVLLNIYYYSCPSYFEGDWTRSEGGWEREGDWTHCAGGWDRGKVWSKRLIKIFALLLLLSLILRF
jgi:hypothetical protein